MRPGELFAERFVQLAGIWLNDPNYSHGFVVPVLSAWLAWRHYRTNEKPAAGEQGPALAAVACPL